MTQTHAQRITYEGNPAQAHALGQMLEEEGVRVDGLIVSGTSAAINTAISNFRKRFPDTGSVTIEDDH